tara:strand:- start:1466 stop:1753 length:288 start_codon:yes stop_codon:yes gene_type:complete
LHFGIYAPNTFIFVKTKKGDIAAQRSMISWFTTSGKHCPLDFYKSPQQALQGDFEYSFPAATKMLLVQNNFDLNSFYCGYRFLILRVIIELNCIK